jgi:ABC-2 type transport system permease protein
MCEGSSSRTVASFNPLNWSLDSARGALAADPDWGTVAPTTSS